MAIGDRVAAVVRAGYAEYCVTRADALIALPDSVDFLDASILPVQGITAYQILVEAGHLHPGDVVLVHAAAGAVGGLAVQLARLLRAKTVLGTAGNPDKLDHVRDLGADGANDYRQSDWSERVLEATHGKGPTLVLDSVGGAIAQTSLSVLAPFGRVVTYGAASGQPAQLDPTVVMQKNAVVAGYSRFGWQQRPDRIEAATLELIRAVQSGRLRLKAGQRFALEEAVRAHEALEQRRTIGPTVPTARVRAPTVDRPDRCSHGNAGREVLEPHL